VAHTRRRPVQNIKPSWANVLQAYAPWQAKLHLVQQIRVQEVSVRRGQRRVRLRSARPFLRDGTFRGRLWDSPPVSIGSIRRSTAHLGLRVPFPNYLARSSACEKQRPPRSGGRCFFHPLRVLGGCLASSQRRGHNSRPAGLTRLSRSPRLLLFRW
jgi:hypothetical protein